MQQKKDAGKRSAFHYFSWGLVRCVRGLVKSIWRQFLVILSVISALLLINWKIGDREDFVGTSWASFWKYLKLLVWWIGLGTLSSIGLGSGMHTGILFVFPHIYSIVRTSENCNNLEFDPTNNMWGMRSRRSGRNLFVCQWKSPPLAFKENVTVTKLVLKSMPYALLWGFGSVLGELPPYAASFAAASSQPERRKDIIIREISKNNNLQPSPQGGIRRKIARLHLKLEGLMVWFVEAYGSWAVFLLSCWPNAFFDVCGIVCGTYQMPFWNFFIPLTLGKAVVKTTIQTTLTVALLSKTTDQLRARLLSRAWHTAGLKWWMRRRFKSADESEKWILDWLDRLRSHEAELPGRDESLRSRLARKILSIDFTIKFISLAVLAIFFLQIFHQLAREEYERQVAELQNETDAAGAAPISSASEFEAKPLRRRSTWSSTRVDDC